MAMFSNYSPPNPSYFGGKKFWIMGWHIEFFKTFWSFLMHFLDLSLLIWYSEFELATFPNNFWGLKYSSFGFLNVWSPVINHPNYSQVMGKTMGKIKSLSARLSTVHAGLKY
jgi:hypothetical protein